MIGSSRDDLTKQRNAIMHGVIYIEFIYSIRSYFTKLYPKFLLIIKYGKMLSRFGGCHISNFNVLLCDWVGGVTKVIFPSREQLNLTNLKTNERKRNVKQHTY